MRRWASGGAALRRATLATLLCLGSAFGGPIAVGVASAGGAASVTGTASVIGAASAGGAASAVGAQAADGASSTTPDPVRALVTVATVTPTIMRPNHDVVIKGTVTAPSSGRLDGARLAVVLGDVVTRREDVTAWAQGSAAAEGRRVAEAGLGTVAAGATVSFTVRIPSAAANPHRSFAVLPIALEVLQDGSKTPAGSTRTFVPWKQIKEYVPLELATLMPLTLDPSVSLFSRDTSTRVAAWQSAIGPGSRVARIIEGTRESTVTLAVDPALFGPTAGVASPPPTPTPGATTAPPSSGQPSSGVDADSAVDTLSQALARSLEGRALWALPYADADLAAAVDLDPTNPLMRDLVARSNIVAAEVGQPVRADISWPVDGLLTAGRETRLRNLYASTAVKGPAGIVVNQAGITIASDVTPGARRVAAGGTRLLGYDPVLSQILSGLTPQNVATSTQRYLAESLVLLGERPGISRSVLVVTPRTFDPDPAALRQFMSATSEADWLTPVQPDTLLTDSGGDTAEKAARQQSPPAPAASAAPNPVLTSGRLRLLAQQRDTLLRVAAVLRDGATFERTYREVLDELGSARWRYQPGSWAILSNAVTADTKAATSAIRVVGGRKVNFLAENGSIRVTVSNGLDYDVRGIRLVLTPTTPRMQVVEQPPAFDIAAGPGTQKVIEVPLRAVAAGRADIEAQLTTGDGTPIGLPQTIHIGANPLDSTIYWVGGALVGLVLLAGIVRTVRKGTSRIDEIGDLETVAKRDEAAEERKRG